MDGPNQDQQVYGSLDDNANSTENPKPLKRELSPNHRRILEQNRFFKKKAKKKYKLEMFKLQENKEAGDAPSSDEFSECNTLSPFHINVYSVYTLLL